MTCLRIVAVLARTKMLRRNMVAAHGFKPHLKFSKSFPVLQVSSGVKWERSENGVHNRQQRPLMYCGVHFYEQKPQAAIHNREQCICTRIWILRFKPQATPNTQVQVQVLFPKRPRAALLGKSDYVEPANSRHSYCYDFVEVFRNRKPRTLTRIRPYQELLFSMM
jgi:hypothetical protein